MERGLQKIFVDGFDSYTKSRGVSDREYRAARHFSFCRTARLGGHKEVCPEGHFVRAHYHSCRHRSCPQCNALASARWLEAQKAKLLDCPHHHMVFTIPHELILCDCTRNRNHIDHTTINLFSVFSLECS